MISNLATPNFRNLMLNVGATKELLLLASSLVVTFFYLDVPIGNALLISGSITLQAALGSVVLMRLLSGAKGSLLLMIGPGTIVGGALSFALFQIVGRGWIGLATITAVGAAAALTLTRSSSWQPVKTDHIWIMSHILGIAALALTWEFGELLPVAVALFIVGLLLGPTLPLPRIARWLTGIGAGGAIVAAFMMRQAYWWLVTDDYQFFEVMSRHMIVSGPFADWGSSNWSSYHWLSYGWSGLLNLAGGSPEAFVTLTRVMPVLYSLSLGASLILIAKVLSKGTEVQWLTVLPAWTVVALHRLDWSGTSTSAVYATIAMLSALIVLEISTSNSFSRRLGLYALSIPIIVLTKMPSLIAVVIAFALLETWFVVRNLNHFQRLIILVLTPLVLVTLSVTAIRVGGDLTGGWSLAAVNLGLGQLAEFGPWFAGTGVLLQKFWIWIPVFLGVLWSLQKSDYRLHPAIWALSYSAVPLMTVGLISDVKISGNSNIFEYFSGPMYFLGSLILLPAISHLAPRRYQMRQLTPHALTTVSLLLGGFVWVRFQLQEALWNLIGVQIFQWNGLKVVLLQWVSSDGRFAIGLLLLMLSPLIIAWRRNLRQALLIAASVALTAFTLYGYFDHARSELSRQRSADEVAANLGSDEVQTVGRWIRANSDISDLVATNYIVNGAGDLTGDYSLAVWSERTFMVLGPRFGGSSQPKETAVKLSVFFSDNPTNMHCRSLAEQQVKWYVVDLRLTETRSWDICSETAYSFGNFVVLRLTT